MLRGVPTQNLHLEHLGQRDQTPSHIRKYVEKCYVTNLQPRSLRLLTVIFSRRRIKLKKFSIIPPMVWSVFSNHIIEDVII